MCIYACISYRTEYPLKIQPKRKCKAEEEEDDDETKNQQDVPNSMDKNKLNSES